MISGEDICLSFPCDIHSLYTSTLSPVECGHLLIMSGNDAAEASTSSAKAPLFKKRGSRAKGSGGVVAFRHQETQEDQTNGADVAEGEVNGDDEDR